jgi:hypothetical protein
LKYFYNVISFVGGPCFRFAHTWFWRFKIIKLYILFSQKVFQKKFQTIFQKIYFEKKSFSKNSTHHITQQSLLEIAGLCDEWNLFHIRSSFVNLMISNWIVCIMFSWSVSWVPVLCSWGLRCVSYYSVTLFQIQLLTEVIWGILLLQLPCLYSTGHLILSGNQLHCLKEFITRFSIFVKLEFSSSLNLFSLLYILCNRDTLLL